MGEVFSCAENNFTIFQLLDSIMWVFGDVWKNQYICKKNGIFEKATLFSFQKGPIF